MKSLIILLFLLILISKCSSQEKKILSITFPFLSDTTFGVNDEGYKTRYFKIEIDSSNWMLYSIKADTFFYFKIYGYGTEYHVDYPKDSLVKWNKECPKCIIMSGWSDCVAYYDKSYMEMNYLLQGSVVADTIPVPINFYSEAINADNPNALYGHTIIKYYVGGILGELIREEHLNDAKKTK